MSSFRPFSAISSAHVLSRLKGIETVIPFKFNITLSFRAHVLSRLKGIETCKSAWQFPYL